MLGTTLKMPALFIPMMYGIPVLFCGVVALNPHRRRIAIASAAGLMVVAAVGSFARCGYGVALANGEPEARHPEIDSYAVNLAIATTAISVVYLGAYALSLVHPKRQPRQPLELALRSKEEKGDSLPDGPNGTLPPACESEPLREFTASPDP